MIPFKFTLSPTMCEYPFLNFFFKSGYRVLAMRASFSHLIFFQGKSVAISRTLPRISSMAQQPKPSQPWLAQLATLCAFTSFFIQCRRRVHCMGMGVPVLKTTASFSKGPLCFYRSLAYKLDGRKQYPHLSFRILGLRENLKDHVP